FDTAELPAPSFLIVPLAENSNLDALAAVVQKGAESASLGKFETTEKIENALFAGTKRALARIREAKAVSRPEIAKAFAAAQDTAAQFLVLPTADARRVVEEVLPKLPQELGGSPSTILTNGLWWAAVGADSLPNPALRIVIQSKDAASARALKH